MNPLQVEYFRSKLLQLRAAAQRELDGATAVGADDGAREGDQADQASAAVDRGNSALLTANAPSLC